MLTSLGLRLDPRVMQDAGISECLFKPVKEARLFDCLVRIFSEAATSPSSWPPSKAPTVPSVLVSPIYRPLRILLAQGNPVNHKLVLLQLGKLGYEADIATNVL